MNINFLNNYKGFTIKWKRRKEMIETVFGYNLLFNKEKKS